MAKNEKRITIILRNYVEEEKKVFEIFENNTKLCVAPYININGPMLAKHLLIKGVHDLLPDE